MRGALWFCAVIFLSICVRVWYWHTTPGYLLTADSISYFTTAKRIAKTGFLADEFRTPVYPLVFLAAFTMRGHDITKADPYVYTQEFVDMRLMQHIAGVVSIALLFSVLLAAGMPMWLIVISCALVAVSGLLLGLERVLLTETFSITILLFSLRLLQSLFTRYRVSLLLMFTAVSVVGVFLRPATIGLPVVLLALLAWRRPTRPVFIGCLCALLLYGISLVTYAGANAQINGYQGISRISDINLLGKVLHYHLPVSDVRIVAYENTGGNDPFGFLRMYPSLDTPDGLNTIAKISHLAILRSFPQYILGVVSEVPGALTQLPQSIPLDGPLVQVTKVLLYVSWVGIIGVLMVVVRALGKKKNRDWHMILITAVILYYIAVTSVLTYDDFGRHVSIILPLVVFFSLWSAWQGIAR